MRHDLNRRRRERERITIKGVVRGVRAKGDRKIEEIWVSERF